MPKRTIHDDVQAALHRLYEEDPGLKRMLKKAHGYAVFPEVGKAALVIGGAYGRGEVYERGQRIGYATIAQTTIGVQVGGDTFTEVLIFDSKEPLDRFKRGRTAFAANASAVLIKAGAAGTADFEKGVAAYAYSEGGMLLEAAIGGQRFHFQEADQAQEAQGEGDQQEQNEQNEQEDHHDSGLLSKSVGGLKNAGAKASELFSEHPLAGTLIASGVLAGAGLLVLRAMRGSDTDEASSDQDEGEEEGQEQDEYDNQADDESEDQREESEADEDSGEQEEQSSRFGRRRAHA